MNTAQLVSALTEALSVVPESWVPDYPVVFTLDRADRDPSEGIRPLKALMEQIRSEPTLEIFNERMQSIGGSAIRVGYTGLAGWLLRRAAAGGPDQAVADLERYLSSEEIPCFAVWALGGITPQGTGKLGDTLELMPWEQLPDSESKHRIGNQLLWNSHPPSAALVHPLLVSRSEIHLDLSKPPILTPHDDTDVHDAVLCAAL